MELEKLEADDDEAVNDLDNDSLPSSPFQLASYILAFMSSDKFLITSARTSLQPLRTRTRREGGGGGDGGGGGGGRGGRGGGAQSFRT